ncbi:MAG: NAD(P) transhydrogenase subunit alpha [Bdellovibrionales bacterium RBG_16_40_8]|nr:MAG: NAD(P) transhydrogenase subunit alpha [Bdellovibrionales bacterium RBG_16_40_8]
MKIGIIKEIHPGEKRVAATPDVIEKFKKLGFIVAVECAAGEAAGIPDTEYKAIGCELVDNPKMLWESSDIILKVRAPEMHPTLRVHEVALMKEGQTLVSFIWPGQNSDLMKKMAEAKINVFAMDSVPRISRAQKLDALSSMANIAGYRAIIEAAHHFGRFFTGQITAAGKVPPAKVLVIGAGVAGLSAIATANGLGAVVRGFDTRPEVKEQVLSMGAEFLELNFAEEGSGTGGYAKQMSEAFVKAEMELFAKQALEVDIIITTALIPGRPAPLLVTADMVKSMKSGSVIVDMAAEQGGNCELTEAGQVVVKHGVTLIGYTDLPSRLARQSSQLYANNLWRLLEELCPEKNGVINIDMNDEVIRGTVVVKNGEITWPPPAPTLTMAPAKTTDKMPAATVAAAKPKKRTSPFLILLIAAIMLFVVGQFAPATFVSQLTVFVLACFVGYMVVWNVTASLHTPLMSVTNAISGIIALGALLQISSSNYVVQILAGIAILISTINIVGGFVVTHRMLKMFTK